MVNKMKFGIGITLYNPTEDNIKYILHTKNSVSNIYVFDNSKKNEVYADFFEKKNIMYNYTGENRGLSRAFNWFLVTANRDNIDFLLLLDQDSMFSIDVFTLLMRKIDNLTEVDDVAMVACKTIPMKYDMEVKQIGIHNVDRVISSGCFLNVKLLNNKNLFYDENLFVDHVDYEFCDRVINAGLKILEDDEFVLRQQLGYYHKNIICHSPVRHYYMVRDIGYVNEKNEVHKKAEWKTFRYYLRDILSALREDRTLEKIAYATKGYMDYKKRITGEYK